MAGALALKSTVVTDKSAISTELEDEVVILDTHKGVYYSLDVVGALVWNLIQTPKSLAEVRDAILREYEVDAETCERDLLALINDLAANRLVRVID